MDKSKNTWILNVVSTSKCKRRRKRKNYRKRKTEIIQRSGDERLVGDKIREVKKKKKHNTLYFKPSSHSRVILLLISIFLFVVLYCKNIFCHLNLKLTTLKKKNVIRYYYNEIYSKNWRKCGCRRKLDLFSYNILTTYRQCWPCHYFICNIICGLNVNHHVLFVYLT